MIQDRYIQRDKISDSVGLAIRGLSRQKHLATPIRSETRKVCCTKNAKQVIMVVCCVYWLQTSLWLYSKTQALGPFAQLLDAWTYPVYLKGLSCWWICVVGWG